MPLQLSGTNGVQTTGLPFLVGQVCFFAMQAAPTGFLICDGRAISRTTYASLFAAIGTLYGVGDGSTTFNLPDLRGEFIRGWDGTRGEDAGRTFGSWQKGSIVGGEDVTPGNSVNVPIYGGDFAKWGLDDPKASWATGLQMSIASRVSDFNLSDTGSTSISFQQHSGVTRPRNVALLPCVFAGV